MIPQEAGLNERAVSFTKGCYVGQETVARLFYRGKPNRHLRGLRLSAPVEPGTPLRLGEKEVGRVASVASSPPPTARSRWRSCAARRSPARRSRPATARRPPRSSSCRSRAAPDSHCAFASRSTVAGDPVAKEPPMAAHVLVLANVTAASGDLIDAIRQRAEKGPIDVTLLMPGRARGCRAARPSRRLDARSTPREAPAIMSARPPNSRRVDERLGAHAQLAGRRSRRPQGPAPTTTRVIVVARCPARLAAGSRPTASCPSASPRCRRAPRAGRRRTTMRPAPTTGSPAGARPGEPAPRGARSTPVARARRLSASGVVGDPDPVVAMHETWDPRSTTR